MRTRLLVVLLLSGCAGTDPVMEEGPIACPAIGCADYLQLQADTTLSREEIMQAHYTACRNDECFEGSFEMLWRAGGESETALSPEQHAEKRDKYGGGPSMSLNASPGDSVIHVTWGTPDDGGKDGDRYTLSAKLEDDTVVELLDTQIEHHEETIMEGTPCELTCVVAEPVMSAQE
jgi:hypothetical protein